jgi:hypothetical protein
VRPAEFPEGVRGIDPRKRRVDSGRQTAPARISNLPATTLPDLQACEQARPNGEAAHVCM